MKRQARDIILTPIVTECSMKLIPEKKYSFKVHKKANKVEIAKAIKELFKVDVLKVNTMNYKGRHVRHGRSGGYRSDWKKAIVTLKSNSKTIEFFDNLIWI